MNFQFRALPGEQCRHFSGLNDQELKAIGVRRMVVDDNPGYPCRVSLADAEVGEVVYLPSHVHHDVASPYRAAGLAVSRKPVG